MAREFARIGTDMPHELSIRALDVEPSWLYDRLLMSREMSRCGVVPLRPALWADLARNATEPKVRRWLAVLEDARLVIVDQRYAEVLVRTYVRHDHLLGQPNVVAALVADYQIIASPHIRLALLQELRRIHDLTDLPPAERGGWLLAMGVLPSATASDKDKATWPHTMTPAALNRLAKAMKNTSLAGPMLAAIRDGHVQPFPEGSAEPLPEGFAEPFTGPLAEPPGTRTRGRTRAFTGTGNGTGNGTGTGKDRLASSPSPSEVEVPATTHQPAAASSWSA